MLKRLLDILLASIGLVLFWPVLVLAAIGIVISSPGPVLFMSERVGLRGRRFMMYKLRTMHVEQGGERSPITAARDQRIFRFGAVLRLIKLDELPQLLNVLYGDMSIVGPRPLSPKIVDTLYSSSELMTLDVRPGLSSPGSIYNYTHCELLVDADNREECFRQRVLPLRLALEQVYLIRSSLLYDAEIIVRTVLVILLKVLGKSRFSEPPEMQDVRRMKLAFSTDEASQTNRPSEVVSVDMERTDRTLLIGPEEVAKWIPKRITSSFGLDLNIVSRIEPQDYTATPRSNSIDTSDDAASGLTSHVATLDRSFDFSTFIVSEGALPGWEFRRLWRYCRDKERRVGVLPSSFGNAVGQSDVVPTREVRVSDLFNPQSSNSESIGELKDSVVLVTGAGSAIGCEIVRQLCDVDLQALHVIDGSEELLARAQAIVRSTSKSNVRYSLMDDRFGEAIERTMRRIRPTVVIHAGCQLNETIVADNVSEALQRNLFGVMAVIDAAEAAGCQRSMVIVGPRTPTAACPLGAVSRIAEQQLMRLAASKSGVNSKAPQRLIVRVGRLMDSTSGVIRLVEEGIQRGDGVRIPSSVLDDNACTGAAVAARGVLSALIEATSSGVYSLSDEAMWDRMDVIQTVLEFHGRSVESLPIILGEAPVDMQRAQDEYRWSAHRCEFDSNLDAISLPRVELTALQRVVDRLEASTQLPETELSGVLQRCVLEFQTGGDFEDESPTVLFTTDRRLTGDESGSTPDAPSSPAADVPEVRRDA